MKFAVVRIRGVRKIIPRIRKTLEFLRLERPNHCVLLDDTPQNVGMLEHAKDYITFGPVSEEMVYKILFKRGKKDGVSLKTSLKEDGVKKIAKEVFAGKKVAEVANPVFRLNPPSKGYNKIKQYYPEGELGKRVEMDSLLRRMV